MIISKSLFRRCLAVFILLQLSEITVHSQSGRTATVSLIHDTPNMVFVTTGDLNGDGIEDLAGTEATWSRNPAIAPVFRLHLFFRKNGGFSMPSDRSIDLPCPPSGLAVGDYDNDGRADVVVGLRSRRSIAVYPGSNDFNTAHISKYNNDSGGASLSVGHINNTGLVDFMTGAAWRKWYGGDRFGNGYFCGPERNDNFRSTLVDLNWDGLDDVVFTTVDNRIRIYYGPFLHMGLIGVSAAFKVVTLASPFTGSGRHVLGQAEVVDVNGDSQSDVIVNAREGLLVYLQNSPIGFSENAEPSFLIKGVTLLAAEDIDGNGLCDIVCKRAGLKGLCVWFQIKGQPLSSESIDESRCFDLPRDAVAATVTDAGRKGVREILVSMNGGGLAVVKFGMPQIHGKPE